MGALNIRVVTWSLASFTSFSFVACVLYGLIVSESFHAVQFLEIVLPGFKWLSIGSFLIGLVESTASTQDLRTRPSTIFTLRSGNRSKWYTERLCD